MVYFMENPIKHGMIWGFSHIFGLTPTKEWFSIFFLFYRCVLGLGSQGWMISWGVMVKGRKIGGMVIPYLISWESKGTPPYADPPKK